MKGERRTHPGTGRPFCVLGEFFFNGGLEVTKNVAMDCNQLKGGFNYGREAWEEGTGIQFEPVGTKAMMFWESLLKLNGIPERDFFKELKRDNDSTKALERVFVKMNRRAAMSQKKVSSGKGRRTR